MRAQEKLAHIHRQRTDWLDNNNSAPRPKPPRRTNRNERITTEKKDEKMVLWKSTE